MEAAYVFGNLGNMTSALGGGWSVEDEFAWAIGQESYLTLPLPGDDRRYVVRFDVHPAVFRHGIEGQRLTILCDGHILAEEVLTKRCTIAVTLPDFMSAGRDGIALRLLHPDHGRPSDYGTSTDNRELAICFHSGTLSLNRPTVTDAVVPLEPVHGLIVGDRVARVLAQIAGKLPCLAGRVGLRLIDGSTPLEKADLPDGAIETASFCWVEANTASEALRAGIQDRLPNHALTMTLPSPVLDALWPFQAPDPRARVEPGRHTPARYPYGDRIALQFTAMNMPDDVVYLMYEMAAEQDRLDLDGLFAADLRRMREHEARTDMRLADFIEDHIASRRLFVSPALPGPALIQEMALQLLDLPAIHDAVRRKDLEQQLDALLDGYTGFQEELPVHKRVAAHFGLAWWTPEMTYRWHNNLRTYRSHTLDYLHWVQWRP